MLRVISQVLLAVIALTQPALSGEPLAPRNNGTGSPTISNNGPVNPVSFFPGIVDFGSVAVGTTKSLQVSVQNLGAGPLRGQAGVPEPFVILGGSPYSVENSKTQIITIQYAPTNAGMNISAIRLTGAYPASISVKGMAHTPRPASPARPARPSAPANLKLIAGDNAVAQGSGLTVHNSNPAGHTIR